MYEISAGVGPLGSPYPRHSRLDGTRTATTETNATEGIGFENCQRGIADAEELAQEICDTEEYHTALAEKIAVS